MTQTTLDGKPLTKLMRLRQLRKQYYEQYCEDISNYALYTKQKTETYKQTVKSLDIEIAKELRKQK